VGLQEPDPSQRSAAAVEVEDEIGCRDAFLDEFFIAEEFRGQGTGRRVLGLALSVVETSEIVRVPTEVRAQVFTIQNGRVIVVPARYQLQIGRQIIGVTFRIRNLQAAGQFLDAPDASAPPSAAHGLWLRFEEP
jgi:hypothetical protein